MTRFHPGDIIMYGAHCGEIIFACPIGFIDQLCIVQFGTKEKWIMAHELSPVVELRLPFVPRVVGGTDHAIDTLPCEVQP